MDEQKLKQLDERRALPVETEWVEFKEAKTSFDSRKLGQYFSALSNEANLKNKPYGWLVFGVSDKTRAIVGTSYRKKDLDSLKREVADNTTGRITFADIHELNLPEGRVIMFQIPAASKGIPVSWAGHYYGRDGESLGARNMHEIEQIRNQDNQNDWSVHVCERATIRDLNPAAIQKAKEQYTQKNPRKSREVNAWDDITFLNKAKLAINGKITRAAIILLGTEESSSHLSPYIAQITWILRDKNNKDLDYAHFFPPFILNIENVFAKIRNITIRHLPDGTLFPKELSQYDPWVIREALHNAIAHQDYKLKGKINIIEKPDELIFSNVGDFIPGSIEEVIRQDAPPSIYRNPWLAQAMVNLNMIDTIGSGIKKMFLSQKDRYFPLPDFDLSRKKVVVRVPGKILDNNYTQLLINKTDLDLNTVILLDKIQKRLQITRTETDLLRKLKLVEGRYPNIYISSHIALITGQKAKYIRQRGLDENHYTELVMEFLKKYNSASRKDINELLMDKLPEVLSPSQKVNKINRLLAIMRIRKLIRNAGSDRLPKWMIIEEDKI